MKSLRIFAALVFFLSLSVIFIDIYELLIFKIKNSALFFQFMPSVLSFKNAGSLVSSGFLFVLILTLLFGRIYCSSVCPIGIAQDLLLRIKNLFKKNVFKYSPPFRIRYLFLIAAALSLIAGNMFVYNILDPYANFGRIMITFFRPLFILFNNTLGSLLEDYKLYLLFQTPYPDMHFLSLLFAGFYFLLILILSFKGRIYCNLLCPVGALLGILSGKSLFKININRESCIQCKKCEQVCKASCIDLEHKEIDNSRCVACFNCLSVCSRKSIRYGFSGQGAVKNEEPDTGKRNFLKTVLIGIPSFILPFQPRKACADEFSINEKTPVSPPGSGSISHFTENCISCHLCIGVCPSNVLEPALFDYGIKGILQPTMNYEKSFCNYECFKCSEICPTGAIEKITKKQKKEIQVGKARFIKEKCIVYTKNTDCGACSEHCPTKAVNMVPYQGGLAIPLVEEQYCVGCGACEFACPVLPEKAIIVNGNEIHQKAEIRKEEKHGIEYNAQNDFPF